MRCSRLRGHGTCGRPPTPFRPPAGAAPAPPVAEFGVVDMAFFTRERLPLAILVHRILRRRSLIYIQDAKRQPPRRTAIQALPISGRRVHTCRDFLSHHHFPCIPHPASHASSRWLHSPSPRRTPNHKQSLTPCLGCSLRRLSTSIPTPRDLWPMATDGFASRPTES
jgi:hypothetical protein